MNPRTTWIIVEIATSEGVVGLGEATMSGDDRVVGGDLATLYDRYLHGRDSREIPRLVDELAAHAATAASFPESTAASALEQALWDVRGQELELPVHALLGGAQRREVPVYATLNRAAVERTPQAFAIQAAAAVAAGFSSIKCAPFDELTPAVGAEESPENGLARIGAVREAIGPACELMVDCHGRLGTARALELLPSLAAFGLKWLEDPVITSAAGWLFLARRGVALPADASVDLEGLDALGRQHQVEIAAGELERGLPAFLELLGRGALRYVMPDVKHCGGIRTTALVAAAANALGVEVTPHNPSGPVATLASAHVAAAAATFDSLEIAWGELVPETCNLISPPLEVADGRLVVPSGPGLGARLVQETVDRLSVPFDDDAVAGPRDAPAVSAPVGAS